MKYRCAIDLKGILCVICSSDKIGIYYRYKDYVIYICHKCGMLFRNPRTISKYDWHEDETYSNNQSNLADRMMIAKNISNRIEKYINIDLNGLKILEIGVGTGALGSELVSRGAFYQGIEPSEVFFNRALNSFPLLKGRIQNCSLQSSGLKGETFDLIVMVYTLEHILFPLDFLMKIKMVLKKEGFLYLEVPNEHLLKLKGILRKKIGCYHGYPSHIDHVNFFTKFNLKSVAVRSGFEKLRIFQHSVLADYNNMHLIFPSFRGMFLKSICSFFKITKIDILFGLGNLSVISKQLFK